MTINTLNQKLDINGSINHDPSMDLSEEALHLGGKIFGQSGAAATITIISGDVVVSGITGMSVDSLNRYITLSDAADANNNGTFLIIEINSSSSIVIENALASTDLNIGSISWIEREPYSLEDDINYIRTDRENIKTAIGIEAGETDVDAELTNKTSYFPFNELPVMPAVVDALNVLNREIGDRNYTGLFLTDGYTITQSLQQLSDSATGISSANHAALRQLIHLADGKGGPFEEFLSGAYREILGGVFPTSVIWWESSAKLEKIVEKNITRNSNQTPSSIEWKVYDIDGVTVLATATDSISYTGIFETSRTRIMT